MDYGDKPAAAKRSLLTPPRWSLFAPPLTTAADALSAVSSLDSAIGQASSAVASLGSSASRIENQSEFTTTLVDSLRVELGNLVDANLAEKSAALEANQVRQRLGIVALNIANSSPQTLLALFE